MSAAAQAFARQLFVVGSGYGEDEVARLDAYGIDAETGALTKTESVPVSSVRNAPVLVHPSGEFVYAVGRDIDAYRVDVATGQLSRIGVAVPTGTNDGAAMDPLGRFTPIGGAVYTIDPTTGALTRQMPRAGPRGPPIRSRLSASMPSRAP